MANEAEGHAAVAGIILAAGLGRRMGATKVLLPWQGQPLIRHLARVALASHLDQVLVVTGHRADDVAAALEGLPVHIVLNANYSSGLSSSVHVGIAALPKDASGALIMLADQPLLTTGVIDALIQAHWSTGAPVVAPCADGRRGNPVLFARMLFPELLQISGDEGARSVIDAYRDELWCVDVDEAMFQDVDTPEAYSKLLASQARQ